MLVAVNAKILVFGLPLENEISGVKLPKILDLRQSELKIWIQIWISNRQLHNIP